MSCPKRQKGLYRVNDHEFLLTATDDLNAVDLSGLEGKEREAAIEEIEEEKGYEVFDELPFWANGKGVVNKLRTRLYHYDSQEDKLHLLSPEYMNVSSFDYDEQTDRVLYYGHDYQWMDDQKDDLYVRLLHGEKQVQVDLQHRYGVDAAQFVGGKILLAMSEGKRYGTNENPAFYLADPDTGAVSELCDLDPSLRSTVGSDCRYGGGKRQKGNRGQLVLHQYPRLRLLYRALCL